MLHILLLILKVIGILLLVIFGIALLLILAVLLVPFRYRIRSEKQEMWHGKVTISWLVHILHFVGKVEGTEFSYEIYLFGIPVMALKAWLEKHKKPARTKHRKVNTDASKKRKKKNAKTPEHREKVESETSEKFEELKLNASESMKEESKEENKEKSSDEIQDGSKEESKVKKVPWWKRVWNIIKSIIEFPKKVIAKVRNIITEIRETRGTARKWLRRIGMKRVKAVLRHIRPRQIKGEILFGFDDPAKTGETLGVFGMMYPILPKRLKIIPDFTQPIFEGQAKAKGRIYLVFILFHVLQVIFYKDDELTKTHGGKKNGRKS